MNPFKIINKYYNSGSEKYQILIIHSAMVAKKSLEIAELFSNRTGDNIAKNFIYEAAMLHDIGFDFPKGLKTRKKLAACYISHGYYGAEILRKEGFPKHAKVAENHVGLGLSKKEIVENKWPIPPKDYYPETVEEKIISYADLFYSKGSENVTRLFKERTKKEVIEKIKKYRNAAEKVKIFSEWNNFFSGIKK